MGYRSKGLPVARTQIRRSLRILEKRTKQNRGQAKRIDVLPDDILLEIFDFYVDLDRWYTSKAEVWQLLVHVCRRWRSLVFQSPRRLNLRLVCTPERDTLDIWPALPLIVEGIMGSSPRMDNIIAALGKSNRVCKVTLLGIAGWQLEHALAAMQVSFPELTDLRFSSDHKTPPVIPDSFLGGSAPRLQYFELDCISFPGLPQLLLSAHHLVDLWLFNLPHSGYISPEAMVALISVLSSLDRLVLQFQSPQSRPDWQSPNLPPPKHSILPALNSLYFKGVTEYLEDLVTRIDTPQLHAMNITFFNEIDFDCPRLAQFINSTPTFRALDEARVQFNNSTASIQLRYRISELGSNKLWIGISCGEPDWQLSSIEQVSNSSLPPVSKVENLYIEHPFLYLDWKNDGIENTLWLQLLLPFTTLKSLYLSEEFAPGIASSLQELVGARVTEVLPNLKNIFVKGLEPSGPFHEKIGQFVAARQSSGHPIVISNWGQDKQDQDTDSSHLDLESD